MMNVYTRRPNRLNGDIFTTFEDTDDFGQQRGGRQTKKEVCFDLGDSLMPVDMERKDCDNKDSGLKGKVKIPDLFQGIEMDKGVNAGRSENMNAVTTKTRGDIDKDKIVLQNRKDDKIVVEGIKQGTESSAKSEVNRPASKLIEDQNDLSTLFDTLHGKEADKAVSRRIGKLRMPGIFDKAGLGNQSGTGKKTEAGNDRELTGNGGVCVEAGNDREAGLKSGRGRSFDNALEMSFSDWKRGSELEKEADENTYGMQNREGYNFGVYKGDSMRGGWAVRSSIEKGGNADDRTKRADKIDDNAGISVRNNIWMSMKNGSQSLTPQKSGENQNCQAANGKNIDGMKQGTSDSQLIVINDAKGDLAGKGLFMNKSTNIREGEEDCLVGRQRFEGIKKLETAMVNNEDKSNSLAANGRGNATIGKLKMPEKFANVGGNNGQRKDLGNRQKGTRLSEKGFEGSRGIVSTEDSNSSRRNEIGGRDNDSKINQTIGFEDSKGNTSQGATNTKKQSDFAVKQNFGKVNENQGFQGSRGIFNVEASKRPVQESPKKFEAEKKRFQNGNPVDKSRFSQSEKIGHDAVVNTMDTDGNQASKVSSDGSGKVGKLEFGSGINARESQSSQPVFSDTSDGLAENSSNTGHKPQRQIGRLNINSIFANANDKESGKADKEKEDDSVFSKNKAAFDQKPNKTQGKQDKVGKLRVNSTRSERDEELANLSPEGEVPSNMSANMKLQLEKILQQRSASVSSQGSLVSPKNDGRESSSSRLSISSVSSGGSPRFRGSFSSDSNLLRYTSYEESDNGDDQGPKKVNNGSLKFQLDGIFQARVPGSRSVESSPANSLDASLNSEGFDDSDLSARKPSVEDDRKEKRKLIADAIKLKYGGKQGGEKSDNEEDGGKRDDKDDSGAKGWKDRDKGDKGPENTPKQFIGENDIGIAPDSGTMGNKNVRQGNGSWKGESDRPCNKETRFVPKSQENKSTKADGRSGYDQENRSLENAKRRGKVSIPGIFSGMPDTGIRDKETGSVPRSATLKGGQSEMATSSYEETGTRRKESPREDSAEKKERVHIGIRKLNIPSNFQTNSAAQRSGDGDDNNSRPKAVSFMQKSAESNDLMNGKKTEHPQDLNQVTGGNTKENIEQVKNSDEIKENNANADTRRKPAGKLSSSMFQAFQRNDKESTGEKLSGGNSYRATGVGANKNSSSGKLTSQAQGQSSVHDTVSRMKEISTENEAMSRGIDTPVQVEKEDGRHANDDNNNNSSSNSNNNNNNNIDNEDANNNNNNNNDDDNNNEDDKYDNNKGIGFEAKTKWQSQQSFKQDQLQPSTEVVVSSKRAVGKLNIPLAFK